MQTHFWNFEDEKLKAASESAQDSSETQTSSEFASVLYYEQPSSGQMVPRALMNDFRDNFGNFSACFAVETQADSQP